jgi:tetratricopeptide (TPR) repeat protein
MIISAMPRTSNAMAIITSRRNISRTATRRRSAVFLLLSIVLSFGFNQPALSQPDECPDLTGFLAFSGPDWQAQVVRLEPLMGRCLESSQYFALLGAAQLNSGLLADAFESLERALLLDPDNGAAQVDYSQALFQEGQIFNALELNERLLARTDLPSSLLPVLRERDKRWRALTRQNEIYADLLLGYDDNLNGAPAPDLVTLTLSGESVLLPLNPEFRPISGPYGNIRLGGRHRRLSPGFQQNFSADIRGRLSEDSDSDLLQADMRYNYIRPSRRHSWQFDTGISNLLFGGSPLFSAAEARARYSAGSLGTCRPFYDLALQYQLYHDQSTLNAADSRLSAGLSCPLGGAGQPALLTSMENARISLSAGVLNSQALRSERPGGDRQGWQLNADLQFDVGPGSVRTVVNHTRMRDRETYSELLISGGMRRVERSYVLAQYRQAIDINGFNTVFMANLFHQYQASNIELFENRDTTFEIGLSFRFR